MSSHCDHPSCIECVENFSCGAVGFLCLPHGPHAKAGHGAGHHPPMLTNHFVPHLDHKGATCAGLQLLNLYTSMPM
jgi:hypothetical protein